MFMLAVTAPEETHSRIVDRVNRHLAELEHAGAVRAITLLTFGRAILVYDAASPFAHLEHRDGGVLLRGGFRTETGGEYAEIHLSDKDGVQTLRGETDLWASWPMFFGGEGEVAAVGNDAHAVAIALGLSELNEESVFQFLTLQFVFNRCTTIRGVQRLWQGEAVTLTAARSPQLETVHAPNRFDQRIASNDEARDEHTQQTYAALVRSVEECGITGGDVVCALSGGLDSRLVAGAMHEAGVEGVGCVTFNLSKNDEGAVAAEVAESLGFPHLARDLPNNSDEHLRQAWLMTGGQKTLHAATDNLLIARTALGDRAQVRLVSATVGDPLDGSLVPAFEEFVREDSVALCGRFWLRRLTNSAAAEQGLGGGRTARAHMRAMRRELARQFAEAQGATGAEKTTVWDFTRRGPVFTHLTTSKLSSNILEVQPGLTPGYVSEYYRLRPIDVLQRNFYRKLIFTQLPAFHPVIDSEGQAQQQPQLP